MPDYDWDERKRSSNLAKHRLDFVDAWQIIEGDHVRSATRAGSDGEARCMATGIIGAAFATVIFTMRGEVVRIISLRHARTQERMAFDAALQQRGTSAEDDDGQKPH